MPVWYASQDPLRWRAHSGPLGLHERPGRVRFTDYRSHCRGHSFTLITCLDYSSLPREPRFAPRRDGSTRVGPFRAGQRLGPPAPLPVRDHGHPAPGRRAIGVGGCLGGGGAARPSGRGASAGRREGGVAARAGADRPDRDGPPGAGRLDWGGHPGAPPRRGRGRARRGLRGDPGLARAVACPSQTVNVLPPPRIHRDGASVRDVKP
jgi:hypothetical protein